MSLAIFHFLLVYATRKISVRRWSTWRLFCVGKLDFDEHFKGETNFKNANLFLRCISMKYGSQLKNRFNFAIGWWNWQNFFFLPFKVWTSAWDALYYNDRKLIEVMHVCTVIIWLYTTIKSCQMILLWSKACGKYSRF